MGNSCIYVTYNLELKKYLWSKGISTLIHGLNPNTKNLFWVYERNEKLNKALDEWFNNK